MSTPVEEYPDPFGDAHAVLSTYTATSSGVMTSIDGGSPTDRPIPAKGKKKVGFSSSADVAGDRAQRTSWIETSPSGATSPLSISPHPAGSPEASGLNTPSHPHRRSSSGDLLLQDISKSHLPELSQQQTDQIRGSLVNLGIPGRPRPALRRPRSPPKVEDPTEHIEGPEDAGDKLKRQRATQRAYEEGRRVERMLSEPNSRNASPERNRRIDDIPLRDFNRFDEDDQTDVDEETSLANLEKQKRATADVEAIKLVRRHTIVARGPFQDDQFGVDPGSAAVSGTVSGAVTPGNVTPTEERNFMEDYQPRPQHYRGGILGNLLKLYGDSSQHESRQDARSLLPKGVPEAHVRSMSGGEYSRNTSAMSTPQHSPPDSGASTPRRGLHPWYMGSRSKDRQSTSSLSALVGSSASVSTPYGFSDQLTQRLKDEQERNKQARKEEAKAKRPGLGGRKHSWNRLAKQKQAEQFIITNHIAETIARQKYLIILCRALMEYGAPTHRLEEYMRMSARVLQTDAQFLYIPGSMIMSFEDRDTHTSEVKLVKVAQGLDLGKLRDVHEVYKDVVHDNQGVEEATTRIKEVMNKGNKFNRPFRIIVYGLAAVCVGPFAFQARLIDLPIAFILGSILGILQLYVAPSSDLYANVFEIAAAVITSFLARAFGSIRGGDLFCFSALAQSSIALILPGYTVLCASLELQSRSIVAGSVRMVYAIIYSLFLGYGITVGTAIYGMIDRNATSETQCRNTIPEYWFFFFVPGFAMCLIIINQAKWKQAPMMMIIAFAGYIVNFFSAKRFQGNTQVSNTLGALAIGVMANLYSRIGGRVENWSLDFWETRLRPRWKSFRKRIFHADIGHRRYSTKSMEEGTSSSASSTYSDFQPAARRVGYSLAAAAMLPAIFVQVPSGIAVQGSLVAGLASANQITGNATNGTQVANSSAISTASSSAADLGLNSIAFTVGYSVIQVAIGITVGLFLSAIVVYPFGKRRSGLFSF